MARFKLMGYEVEGQDENARAASLEEQKSAGKTVVVYETDDNVEARAIVEAGGFFRDRDNYVYVYALVDGDDEPYVPPSTRTRGDLSQPFPQKGN